MGKGNSSFSLAFSTMIEKQKEEKEDFIPLVATDLVLLTNRYIYNLYGGEGKEGKEGRGKREKEEREKREKRKREKYLFGVYFLFLI